MKTLVLGIGNPILTDDAVGLRIAKLVKERLGPCRADVMGVSVSGLELLDRMVGYDRVIIVDAIQTSGGRAGQVYRFELDDLKLASDVSHMHGINLKAAFQLGALLKLDVPKVVTVFAVEAADVTSFSDVCTPEVERVIPDVAAMVLLELGESAGVQRWQRHGPLQADRASV